MNQQQRDEINKTIVELKDIKLRIKKICRKEWKKVMVAEGKLDRFASAAEINKAEVLRDFPSNLDNAVSEIEDGIDSLKKCVKAG